MNLDKIIELGIKLEREISELDIINFCNNTYKTPMMALNYEVAKKLTYIVASLFESQHNELYESKYYIKVQKSINDSKEVSNEYKLDKIKNEHAISLPGIEVIEIQGNTEILNKNINEESYIKLIEMDPIEYMIIFDIEEIIDARDFNNYINARKNKINNKEYFLYEYIINCARLCGANAIRCTRDNSRYYNYYVFKDEVQDFFEYIRAIEINIKILDRNKVSK